MRHVERSADLPVSSEEFYDPSQYGPDLSRGFPGMRVWLSISVFGAAAFRAAISEKRRLAVDAWQRIAALPHIIVDAKVNGYPIRAMMDTGAGRSILQRAAARRADVRGRAVRPACRARIPPRTAGAMAVPHRCRRPRLVDR